MASDFWRVFGGRWVSLPERKAREREERVDKVEHQCEDNYIPHAIDGLEEDGYSTMFDYNKRFPTLFNVTRRQCSRTLTRKRNYP